MGKIIKKKIQGMSWWMKTSLVLLLTLATSVFMYQGWYVPRQAHAAVVSYYVETATATNVGIDGTTTMTALADITVATPPVANTNRAMTNTTAPTGTARWRLRELAAVTGNGREYFRSYTPTYAVPTTIAANATAYADFIVYTAGTSLTAWATMYEYNDTTGIVGVAKGTASFVANATILTAQVMNNVSFGNATFTVAAGNRLLVVYGFDCTSVRPSYLWGQLTSASPSGYQSFTVTESTIVNPTITTLAPNNMTQGATSSTMTITGTGFQSGATVAFSGTGITTGAVTFVSATQLTVPVTVAANETTGARTVTVTNPDTGFATSAFTVNAAPAPTVTSTSPNSMAQNTGPTTVTINGTNFLSGATVAFSAAGVTTGAVTFVSATQLTVPVTVAAGATLGVGNVTVTLPGAQAGTGTGVFTVTAPCAAGTPTGLAVGSVTTSTVPLTWTGAGTTNYYRLYRIGTKISTDGSVTTGAYTDSAVTPPGGTFTYTVSGYNTAGACESAQSSPVSAYVLPATPVAPSVVNPGTGTSLTVAINADTNASTVQYAIRINGGAFVNQFVQAGGTLAAGQVWQTATTWGTIQVTGLTINTAYTFDVIARNTNPTPVSSVYGPTAAGTPKITLPSTITNCGGCHFYTGVTPQPWDGTSRGVPAGRFLGDHNVHASYSTATTRRYGFACTSCHYDNTAKGNAHQNGFINLSGSKLTGNAYSLASAQHNKAVSNAPSFGTCSTIYCHSQGTGGTLNAGDTRPVNAVTSPIWGSGATTCYSCHGIAPDGRPSYSSGSPKMNSHTSARAHRSSGCQVCHYTATTNGTTITNVANHNNRYYNLSSSTQLFHYTYGVNGGTCTNNCHRGLVGGFDATWGQALKCTDCHSYVITRKYGRPGTTLGAVTAEFGKTYGHKKTGRAVVADDDCCVCHLEGNGTTHRPSAYHGDGNIDLRDPKGTGETPITNLTGAAFTFQRFSTSYAAGSRTPTGHTNNADIAQVISIKFCVACHGSTGATNPTARSNNGGTGTATMPFGGINLGANYTVLNGAAVAGGLVDVATQFATTNSSVHPVLGPLNNAFPIATRLAVPYNGQGAGRVAAGYTKSLSVVINCFDCHNNNTGTLLTRRTISAHGTSNTDQVRGTFYVLSGTLCTACHTGYTPTGNHGSGSAMNGSSNNNEGFNNACYACHSSKGTATAPARPISASDYHGFNKLLSGANWPSPGLRPYAFIRAWTGTSYHRPYTANTEFTTGSATCGTGTCPSNGLVGDGSTRTYTPGGAY